MDRGGQPGNNNAVKGRLITDALRAAMLREAKGADGKPTKRLNLMAEKVAELAAQGEPWAVKEAWDRLEGKAPQAIEHSGQLDTGSDGKDAMATLLARIDAISGRLPDKDPTGPKCETPSEPD